MSVKDVVLTLIKIDKSEEPRIDPLEIEAKSEMIHYIAADYAEVYKRVFSVVSVAPDSENKAVFSVIDNRLGSDDRDRFTYTMSGYTGAAATYNGTFQIKVINNDSIQLVKPFSNGALVDFTIDQGTGSFIVGQFSEFEHSEARLVCARMPFSMKKYQPDVVLTSDRSRGDQYGKGEILPAQNAEFRNVAENHRQLAQEMLNQLGYDIGYKSL